MASFRLGSRGRPPRRGDGRSVPGTTAKVSTSAAPRPTALRQLAPRSVAQRTSTPVAELGHLAVITPDGGQVSAAWTGRARAKSALRGLTCGYGGQRPASGLLSRRCALHLDGEHLTQAQVGATWRSVSGRDGPESTPDRSLSTPASEQVNRLSDDFARALGLSWPTRSFQSSSSVGNLRSCRPSSPAGPTTAGRPAERQVRRGTAVAVRRRPRRPDPSTGRCPGAPPW